jgi:hypothetical protein
MTGAGVSAPSWVSSAARRGGTQAVRRARLSARAILLVIIAVVTGPSLAAFTGKRGGGGGLDAGPIKFYALFFVSLGEDAGEAGQRDAIAGTFARSAREVSGSLRQLPRLGK